MKQNLNFLLRKRVLVIIALFLIFVLLPLPDPIFNVPYTTTIETEGGELLGATIAADGQWRFPDLDSVPEKVEKAILLFEDEYFYEHLGVNPISLGKALMSNIEAGKIVRGGSTITMQVIRMSGNNPERTIFQKMLEISLALKLELLYSKEEILKLYASNAPFGGNVVGLSAAAWRYYGRSPDQLSWGEAAALAVLPNSPSLIFPGRNELKFKKKRDFLLDKLHRRGLIDSLSLELSKEENLPGRPVSMPRIAPHLLTRAINDGHKGQRNITSIDKQLQLEVTRLAKHHMQDWFDNFVHNASVLVIDIETGFVKAYVGNIESNPIHNQDVDVITAPRSTGSLLKPFLYAAAIDDGLITPKQLLKDYPVFYDGFSPKNFDLKYRGAVHADEALTRSLNLPFVLLLRDYGVEKFHQKLQRLGMHLDKSSDHYGLSMVLGGAESSLWNLTNMYGNLYRVYRTSFNKVVSKGYEGPNYFKHRYLFHQTLELQEGVENDEVSIAAAWATFKALEGLHRPDEFAGWERFRSYIPISWKTGTSFGFRDAWSIGINGKYVVGVWVGNADGEGRPGLVGGKAAAPLLFRTFELLKGEHFNQVPTQETFAFEVCKQSGQKAGEYCNDVEVVSWPMTVENSEMCPYHHLVHLDSLGKFQVNSSCYDVNSAQHLSWFKLPAVQAWYYRQNNSDYKGLPPFLKGCEGYESQVFMEMIYPRVHTEIFIPIEIDGKAGQSIFEAAHENNDETIYWHLDGEFLGSTKREHQMAIVGEEGLHHLHLIDGQGNELERSFTILNSKKK